MQELLKGIKGGKERAIARAITLIENDRGNGVDLLKKLYKETEISYLVGITGPPGSGKSTLSEQIVKQWLQREIKVAVIAIDPSSQFSGGALLGDRVRMSEIAVHKNVFIRSMATRGSLGGLNPAIFDTILILSAAGYQYILIETVGVGQNEIDIVRLADTTMVLTVPEAGDEIQAFKAGLMEVGNIFVINKADRPEVTRMELTIKQMLEIGDRPGGKWLPPVVKTVATRGEGVKGLINEIDNHLGYLNDNKLIKDKRDSNLRRQLVNLMEERLRAIIIDPVINSGEFAEKLAAIRQHELDPYSAVEGFLKAKIIKGCHDAE